MKRMPSVFCQGVLAFFFDFEDLATAVGAAVRADLMRWDLGLAAGAGDKMHAAQGVMGATAIAAAFGNFTLGMGSHGS